LFAENETTEEGLDRTGDGGADEDAVEAGGGGDDDAVVVEQASLREKCVGRRQRATNL
jgi:hypothetical protein